MIFKKTIFNALLLSQFLLSPLTLANPNDIELGELTYGGTGCPIGSAASTLSQDKKSLSVIFQEFMVEAGNGLGSVARKNCSLAIPVHVPQGLLISVIDVDYRGYVSLPRQAQARLSAEYFFAGSQGPRFERVFNGITDTDYNIQNTLGVSAQVWSPCGAGTILRVNTAMLVRTNRYSETALATLDSADFKAGLLYKIQWRTCR